MYIPPNKWFGRIDGEELEHLRWHQIVQYSSFTKSYNEKNSWGILGFACDEGVQRNKGRIGAAKAPDILRQFCSNFPYNGTFDLSDFGTIQCENNALENAQVELANWVKNIQQQHLNSIVFGGGHEVMYGHYLGLKAAYPTQKIGILNFDAHFDNRAIDPKIGATSGTGFWQIAQEENANYQYLAIGIQPNSNTKALFDTANTYDTEYILASDFVEKNEKNIILKINHFINQVDILYVTVCMDVFSSAFAPGVSAPAYCGIIPNAFFFSMLQQITKSNKFKAIDLAEVNPLFDIDNHTARLGASIIFHVLMNDASQS